MKHTPGPWKFEDVGHTTEISGPLGEGVTYILGYIKLTGDVNLQESNGKLMAAAPDLLEALIYIRDNVSLGANSFDVIDKAIKKTTE